MTTATAPLIDKRPAATPVVTPLLRRPPSGTGGPRLRPAYTPAELLGLARAHAGCVGIAPVPGAPQSTERTYRLVASDDVVEVWVIHWPAGGHLELHDHGGSAGALWVVCGSLEEHVADFDGPRASLRRRSLGASSGIGFGSRYVHDVRNAGPESATSVHAYSPPLRSMTYYRIGQCALTVARPEHRPGPDWAP